MKVLLIGGGGREHVIAQKLSESKRVSRLYCAPGNAGIAERAVCLPFSAVDFDKIVDFSKKEKIDFVFVSPDDPLSLGLVDLLQSEGIRAFGPVKAAARLEGSKAFSKDFMKRHGIPTAEYEVFSDYGAALEYIKKAKYPLVIKADGLALGKGVIICGSLADAEDALDKMMKEKAFGASGGTVVVEEFLSGREVTVLAFTDGKTVKCMPSSQDHKRAYDGDKGLNTGGMGAFAPSPYYTDAYREYTENHIILPTVEGLNKDGIKYQGVIYFGLMLLNDGTVKVIEYNARFGDPEAQAILQLLDSDLMEIAEACESGTLADTQIKWKKGVGFTVVIACGSYPMQSQKGLEVKIENLDKNVTLYHAGTALKGGKLVTNGGRIFDLTAYAPDMDTAREAVYKEIDKIKFDGARYRKDIGLV